MTFQPHDLLFLHTPEGFDTGGARPDWLHPGWLAAAPLVVRREVAPADLVPVGARGRHRNERCKGYVQAAAVARCVTPEMLAHAVVPASDALPPLATLAALAPRLDALGLPWGPAGGTGFYLACGLPALRPDSDLDLLVRAPAPLPREHVDELLLLQDGAACRVDIQLDTGHGGFALAEYARGSRVLLKTAHGPLLVADPWQQAVTA